MLPYSRTPARLTAVDEIRIADDFDHRPFGMPPGELLPIAPLDTSPKVSSAFVIEPWPEQDRPRDDPAPGPGEPEPDPVLAMMAADAEEPGPPVVPVQLEPLARFVPPEPDWRQEEIERQRQRTAAVERERPTEPPRSLRRRPA